ncbi:conserved oligomeric Golgi complex subunit 3 [Coccinella septempunctata]|uniref:conserved oligomeric Golgi complex subunit 3 n=1 Tax=Coccinella septempunctata TaxID=41139 RepID=UPI001D06E866|nr:conserved oligomeric Golgi complex subunit 3 [Coccinella septempunctata]
MNNQVNDPTEDLIQENIAKWQSPSNPLAPLNEEQQDLIYQLEDIIKENYFGQESSTQTVKGQIVKEVPLIDSYKSFIKWFTQIENEIKDETLNEFQSYYYKLKQQDDHVEKLFKNACESNEYLESLLQTHKDVISKTDYLHDLSEDLMKQQRLLKLKKDELNNELKYFIKPEELLNETKNVNSKAFTEVLDTIVDSIKNLSIREDYKEARIYKMRNESLLISLLNDVYKLFNQVITDASRQIIDPENKAIGIADHVASNDLNAESSYSLYYGKFQSAAHKVTVIVSYLEEKKEENENFRNALLDCHKMYLSERLPLLTAAVSKALSEIKEKYKNEFNTLFRSCGQFIMKVCQDEVNCFQYFFKNSSEQFENYLAILCQSLYDILRPCLIVINHIEILSELCGILRRELLNERVLTNPSLKKYIEIMNQLLEDVEERLVFRTNIFFQHDLLGYTPSSGDLAYPEKLIQMENIAMELQEYHRNESRSSVTSVDCHEIGALNEGSVSQFRSYTGNSPADLHAMWYPTVKRTLVCLSRLYFCLDKETFQGLAQEALAICIKTVQNAAGLISQRKSKIDGCLFQTKHLLIVREQIAPFQVDFTVKEVGLDFSNVQKAAMHLISHRDKIFSFGSNNALLEFLLDGTPKVKEYLIDSRKEVDKQLKISCEELISYCTNLLVGELVQFSQKVENFSKNRDSNGDKVTISLKDQPWAEPAEVSKLVSETQKNIKIKVPEIQKSMQLYLANRETEFILFRPIRNNVINAFINLEQTLTVYSSEDQLLIGCPSAVQIGVLLSSVSLSSEIEKVNN